MQPESSNLLYTSSNPSKDLNFTSTKPYKQISPAYINLSTDERERERETTGGDETAVVLHALVGAATGLLLLVLLGDLWGLAPHLTGTSQRSVYLTCKNPSTHHKFNHSL